MNLPKNCGEMRRKMKAAADPMCAWCRTSVVGSTVPSALVTFGQTLASLLPRAERWSAPLTTGSSMVPVEECAYSARESAEARRPTRLQIGDILAGAGQLASQAPVLSLEVRHGF
jgi:hypothetical protein